MENVDLVELIVEADWAEIRLTQTGFEVAHERELTTRQNYTNTILAAVTVGLFFTASLQALAAYYSVPDSKQFGMLIGSVVFGAASIVLVFAITRPQ